MKTPLIFNVNKPEGMTSYDVIRCLKKILPKSCRKIGHLGTLDPFATGVLLVAINGAARINELVHAHLSKTYILTGIFGTHTASGDLTTPILLQEEDADLRNKLALMTVEQIAEILQNKFIGNYWQSPPAYSAAKWQGRPLYEWAHMGINIAKEAKQRTVWGIKVLEWNYPVIKILVEVSAGTYIRTLFQDFAGMFGTCGVLQALQRVAIGHIQITDSLCIQQLTLENLQTKGLEIESILPFHHITLLDEREKSYSHGQAVPLLSEELAGISSQVSGPYLWIMNGHKKILGLAQLENDRLKTVFNLPQDQN